MKGSKSTFTVLAFGHHEEIFNRDNCVLLRRFYFECSYLVRVAAVGSPIQLAGRLGGLAFLVRLALFNRRPGLFFMVQHISVYWRLHWLPIQSHAQVVPLPFREYDLRPFFG